MFAVNDCKQLSFNKFFFLELSQVLLIDSYMKLLVKTGQCIVVLTFEIWDQINPKYDVKRESALVYSSGIISNLQS